MASKPSIVLFRRDLRLADNPALRAGAERGAVIPLFILGDCERPKLGGAALWWLHFSLSELAGALADRGAPLVLRRGDSGAVIRSIVAESGADAVFWNRRYTSAGMAADKALKTALTEAGVAARSFNASLLRDPWEVQTKSGGPYRVFKPFWNSLRAAGPAEAKPIAPPAKLTSCDAAIPSDELSDWRLVPTKPDWAAEFRGKWRPGEKGADAALQKFLQSAADDYAEMRDRPDFEGTSLLSPHLAFGEISPTAIWRAAHAAAAPGEQIEKFLSELGWREFSWHLLYHYPDLKTEPLRRDFADFPWADDDAAFTAWTRGETGYPIVDAGMRQLWRTGWMHNRVRMIVASFLVKDLLIHWRRGEEWFWDTLVDADAASNAANWQWVAGCGADAAPYFRIFNPVSQGEKFDPCGDYVRRFVPELAALPNEYIHRPWTAPKELLAKSNVQLGKNYPEPIVDHAYARKLALEAFAAIRKS